MKWCQRCGQKMREIRPGETCPACGWMRPDRPGRPKRRRAPGFLAQKCVDAIRKTTS